MAKKTIFILAAILIFSVLGYNIWRVCASVPPKKAAENYVRALATGNVDTPLKYSSGDAAFAVSRLKGSKVTAKVEDVSCSVGALGRGWAKVLATVELTLQDGSADVGWYSMDMTKTGQGWKVASFREAKPDMSGVSLFVSGAEADAAKRVFQGYLDALAAGNWQGATKYLAGPARRSQEMGAAVIGKGVVIGRVVDLKVVPVWKRGKSMLVRFGYHVESRDVSVLAGFFRTKQGWRIVKINQI
ncbi:hypothetical protein Desku_2438 [Desulfofundulus kuznetsovii DSM 6115]|uniref:Lipoprotein n=1 Tax=Desulfofundulus kuznetsovii (strain DSM 6115 / VKM B-1805 / 17) TaxID=760568 RepID=A0AAU8PRF8_DESK7|nr:hypothetical protein Desku_2438 [Desulfofundulus kuznetsovii DSM 6115]